MTAAEACSMVTAVVSGLIVVECIFPVAQPESARHMTRQSSPSLPGLPAIDAVARPVTGVAAMGMYTIGRVTGGRTGAAVHAEAGS